MPFKKTALVVEDNKDVRALVLASLAMSQHKLEIFEAEEGAGALDTALIVRPDIVLLDVMMPGALDGFAVLERLRADPRTRAAKVVMLTARGTASDLHQGKLGGCDAYVIKPFSPIQLVQTVDALLRVRRPRPALSAPRSA